MACETVGVNGTDVLVVINNEVVGHQRSTTRTETSAVIDYSSKTARERRVGYGRYESSMSLEHLWVPNASGLAAIRNAIRNADPVTVVVRHAGSDFEQACGIVSGRTEEWPDQGEATIAVDIEIDGAWTSI